MIGTLRGEWIKITTVRSPAWSVASVAVVTILLALAIGRGHAPGDPLLTPDSAATGLLGYGIVILMVMAALQVTGEYHSGTMAISFQINRGRASVIGAKSIVICAVAAVSGGILAFAAVLVAKIAATSGGPELSLFSGESIRLYWGVPVFTIAACLMAIGVANVIRHTAGAVAAVIIWPLLIEGLTTLIPNIGREVASMLPFANAQYFLGSSQGLTFNYNEFGGLVVLVAWTMAVYALGLWSAWKRDV
jgi:ABC-2 type transport system permease protein